ncbi:hypothetical protein GE061_012530 [Apolygus lucorum]|uniref:Uncharacterized protein n=1 Tax=Apolygus lucorum TaxID=248454 RepID=A0A8S9XSJ6_APOLU|nr:hypothetical protein GE061_012530 [Apolygus lucorum]
MCVGVLEAISSVQHITESFLPLDATRKKRRMVVDSGTGAIRHADIGWPGDVPRGLHVIKKRSGLTSPHSSFDLPDDDHSSVRRCSEHFDSAQLERAVSAILLEEDMSSDETSEEVTQILSGVVQSCIEFPTEHSRVPKKFSAQPESALHDTFAPINEPRHVAERMPEKEPLLASEAVEADLVDLKPTERLIKSSSAEMGIDEYDSSESSEKHARENRSISKSETSVSYGSELPSSSLSSDILADEDGKSKPSEEKRVQKIKKSVIKDHELQTDDDTYNNETICDLIDSKNLGAILPDDATNLSPLPQLSVPETTLEHSVIHRSLSEDQVPITIQNDDDRLKPNEPETLSHRESIVELIESTNNIVFSDETRPTLERSESIVELIQSTNSLIFVPETKSEEAVKAIPVERQQSIEELIKSTNDVILCREVLNNEELRSTSDTMESDVVIDVEKSLNHEDGVLSEMPEQRATETARDDEISSTEREVLLTQTFDETAPLTAVSSNDFDETLSMIQNVEEAHVESVVVSEQIPSSCIPSIAERDSVPPYEKTCPAQETKLVTESSVEYNPSSNCLKVLDTPAEVDPDKSKPLTQPILTPSSSEEDDSANSVTTIITECVQTIVDIGPPAKKTDTENQLGPDFNDNETPNFVPMTQTENVGNISASCNKLEELASVEEHAVGDQLGNHDLHINTKDIVSSARSPDSQCDIVASEMVTHEQSVVDKLEQTTKEERALNQRLTLSDELEFSEQPKNVMEQYESVPEKEKKIFDCTEVDKESSLQEPPSDVITTENHDSSLVQDSPSLLEIVGDENSQDEIVSSTFDTSNKPTCLENETFGAVDSSVVLGVVQTKETILAAMESKNLETTDSDEYVAHTLAEDRTEFELVEQVIGDPIVINEEVHNDLPLNSKRSADSATETKAEIVTSTVELAREEDEYEKITSETPQSSMVDSSSSKTQNQELFNSDSADNKTNSSEKVSTENEVTASDEVADSGKSAIIITPSRSSAVETEIVPSTDVSPVSFELSSRISKPQTQELVETKIVPSTDVSPVPLELSSHVNKPQTQELVETEIVPSTDVSPVPLELSFHVNKPQTQKLVETEVVPSTDVSPVPLELSSHVNKPQTQELVETEIVPSTDVSPVPLELSSHVNKPQTQEYVETEIVPSTDVSPVPLEVSSHVNKPQTQELVETEIVPSTDVSPVPLELSSHVNKPQTQELIETLKSTIDAVSASTGKTIIIDEEKRDENERRGGDLEMDSRIRDSPTWDEPASKSSESIPTDSGENVHHKGKTRKTGDRTTESAIDLRPTASEVQQEVRRVSSIDEGDVINVTPSQNRPADMENVQEAPSTSPDKAFWVRD